MGWILGNDTEAVELRTRAWKMTMSANWRFRRNSISYACFVLYRARPEKKTRGVRRERGVGSRRIRVQVCLFRSGRISVKSGARGDNDRCDASRQQNLEIDATVRTASS